MNPIENPDVTRTDRAYWESILTSHGLDAEAGKPPQVRVDHGEDGIKQLRRVRFVGTISNLAGIEQERYRRRVTGKITRRGKGPDSFEPSDPNEN